MAWRVDSLSVPWEGGSDTLKKQNGRLGVGSTLPPGELSRSGDGGAVHCGWWEMAPGRAVWVQGAVGVRTGDGVSPGRKYDRDRRQPEAVWVGKHWPGQGSGAGRRSRGPRRRA